MFMYKETLRAALWTTEACVRELGGHLRRGADEELVEARNRGPLDFGASSCALTQQMMAVAAAVRIVSPEGSG